MKKLLKRNSTYDIDTVEAFACNCSVCMGCLTCSCTCSSTVPSASLSNEMKNSDRTSGNSSARNTGITVGK